MDYLRKFIETAFYCYDIDLTGDILPVKGECLVEETPFLRTMQRIHRHLSGDSIRLIYRNYIDEWIKCPDRKIDDKNLFYTLIHFCREMLTMDYDGQPAVRFDNLFKWREVIEQTGETLLVCAYVAYYSHLRSDSEKRLDWANVLPSDNRQLRFIFEKEGLIDLHQHLKASTSVFDISWVCLMNHIECRETQFRKIVEKQSEAAELYDAVTLAAIIRMLLYKKLIEASLESEDVHTEVNELIKSGLSFVREDIHFKIDGIRYLASSRQKCYVYDYASPDNGDGMAVFIGERRIISEALRHIYSGDRWRISALLHRYILIKARLRERLVQINNNVGFANFDDFERKKEIFIDGDRYSRYSDLLFTLPMYEASRYYHQDYIETRIAPQDSYSVLRRKYNRIKALNAKNGGPSTQYRIIYHFIKKQEGDGGHTSYRDYKNCRKSMRQAYALERLFNNANLNSAVGIDAANSEMNCRPEVFAPAYRHIAESCPDKGRTYHVGEDFYDIADGLRAIDEAVAFLDLHQGDRLGHCIALGIDPERYYTDHDCHLIIPQQVLVDDMIWLKIKSSKFNIDMPPRIQKQIDDVFCEYKDQLGDDYQVHCADIIEYYRSMTLRGDNPEDISKSEDNKYRGAERLYRKYHTCDTWRKVGDDVKDFEIFPEYIALIRQMQEKMMDELESKQIVIECCPTSNYKIGRLGRFINHPIFRFSSVKPHGHHIPVTVNTDDLGIFPTSLPREFELLALALKKERDSSGNSIYQSHEIYDWVERIVRNAHVYKFDKHTISY